MRSTSGLVILAAVSVINLAGCAASTADDDEPVGGTESELNTVVPADVSCKEKTETAYTRGKPSTIKVIRIANKAVSKTTGHAYLKMRDAAKKAGVTVALNSGFRTQAEQQYLYNCYLTKRCNNGNLAARPGYSNHQNGLAIDVSTSTWLAQNAPKLGFVRTVPSEPWHWEYRGKDPGGPCSSPDEIADAGGGDSGDAASDARPPTMDPSDASADGATSSSAPKNVPTEDANADGDNDGDSDGDGDKEDDDESEPSSLGDNPAPTPKTTTEPKTVSCEATSGTTPATGSTGAIGLATAVITVALRRRRSRASR